MGNGESTIRRLICYGFCLFLFAHCGPSDGPYQDHYPNGKVKEEGAYKAGEKSGKWTYYWKTGAKKTIGYYTKGKPSGTWIYYSAEGAALGKGVYKGGKMWNGTFVRFVMGIPKIIKIEEGKEAVAK